MTDPTQALMVVDAEPQAAAAATAPAMLFAWTDDDLQALRQTVAKDCNDSQFKVFVLACRRLGLDPFARQIVPIVQGNRMTPQVTIDGFRLIAERTRRYAGQLGPFWCGEDGEWHEAWLEDGDPVACKVGILRRDFDQPMWGVARTRAYKGETPTWKKMPDVMIAKVAESIGLRKAFPQELAGVYTEDELDQAREDMAAAASPSARGAAAAQPTQSRVLSRDVRVGPPPPRTQQAQVTQVDRRAAFHELRARANAAGIRDEDWTALAQSKGGTADASRITAPGLVNLERHIAGLEATKGRADAAMRHATPAPSPDELAAAQADYDAAHAAGGDEA